MLYKQKNYPEAIRYYNKALEIDSENGVFYNNRGACYFRQKRYSTCLKDCEAALKKNVGIAEAWIRKILCYVFLKNIEEATSCIEKAIELNLGADKYQYGLNWITLENENKKDCLGPMKDNEYRAYANNIAKILNRSSKPINAKIQWMELLVKAGIANEAAKISNEFQSELADHPEFQFVEGPASYYRGQKGTAMQCFLKAKNFAGNNLKLIGAVEQIEKQTENQQEVKFDEGNKAFERSDYTDALGHYAEAISLAPFKKHHELYKKRALAFFHLENYSAAIDNCTKAILEGAGSETMFLRARARMKVQDYENALKDFNRTYHLKQKCLAALPEEFLLRGVANLISKQHKAALDDFARIDNKRFPKVSFLKKIAIERIIWEDAILYASAVCEYEEDRAEREKEAFGNYNCGISYDPRDCYFR